MAAFGRLQPVTDRRNARLPPLVTLSPIQEQGFLPPQNQEK